MLKGNVNRNTSDNKVDTKHRKCCESHWKKSGASLLLKLGKRKTLYFTSICLCKKTSIYQVYATCASLLTGRGNRNHVGNIPRAPRAAPRVPRAHRLVGVPAALQVTRVSRVTRVSCITYHHTCIKYYLPSSPAWPRPACSPSPWSCRPSSTSATPSTAFTPRTFPR